MSWPLQWTITLVAPDATEYDVTERLDAESMSSMDEEIEEEITQFRHGDLTLTLDDSDGYISGLLWDAQPNDQWELRVGRQTSSSDATVFWPFAGVLDIPWSVNIDRKAKSVSIQAFSYSKLLERADAFSLTRTFSDLAASTTSGASTLTLTTGTTTDLRRGDRITVTGQSGGSLKVDTKTIDDITSSTALTIIGTWTSTISNATVTVSSPYYRRKTPTELVNTLLATVPGTTSSLDIDMPLCPIPFATEAQLDGFTGTRVNGGANNAGTIYIDNGTRKFTATSPTSGWTDAGATGTYLDDWSAYAATQPATLKYYGGEEDGTITFDYAGNHDYTTQESESNPGGTPNTTTLKLYKDGAFLVNLDSFSDNAHDGYLPTYLEYDPINDRIWYSYMRGNGSAVAGTGYSTPAGAKTSVNSQHHYLRVLPFGSDNQLGANGWMVAGSVTYGRGLKFYALNSPSSGDPDVNLSQGWPIVRAIRQLHGYIYIIATAGTWGSQTNMAILDASDLSVVADTVIHSDLVPQAWICGWSDGDGEKMLVGCLSGTSSSYPRFFVISRKFAGVVPYADWTNQSVAAAVKDLAIAALSVCVVDVDKVVHFVARQRTTGLINAATQTLGESLERIDRPIWSWYRDCVSVTGYDEDGLAIEAVVGSKGSQARKLDVTSDAIQSGTLAFAVANSLHSYCSQALREIEVTTPEVTRVVLHPMDKAEINDSGIDSGATTCRVLSCSTDLRKMTHRLKLGVGA